MDNDSKGTIAISVVSHGQRDLMARLLADLVRLRPPVVTKLCVTLNIEEPAPPAVRWDGCRFEIVRNPRPLGFGANHNQASRRCDPQWLAIVNPDVRLPADCFAPLLAAARPGDGLLAPRVVDGAGRSEDSARELLTPWQLCKRLLGWRQPAVASRRDWYAGMFLLVRAEAFAAVGGFDSRYFMYLEDADLSLRLRLAGWRTRFVPEAIVVHDARRASRRRLRHLLWHATSLLKHWLSPAFWRYLRRRQALRAESRAG
ncbi:MAG: glycosyltransferase family 2 protein [Betaproteobacteria bacterium]